MKLHKIGFILSFVFAFFGLASASTVPFVETIAQEAIVTETKSMMPPIYENSEKTYKFDATVAKTLLNKKSSLMKVNCNNAQILKDLGFASNQSKVFSLGVGQENFEYTFDFRNCSLRGNKINYTRSNKPLTEKQALAYAKAFMSSDFLSKKLFSQYGDPIVINKNSNNPIQYAMKIDSSSELGDDVAGIEIDTTDTGVVNLAPEYVSFSILFPYKIANSEVYNSYGNKAGVSLEVAADGVTNINAQLLPFKGAVRNAEKLSGDELTSFVKRGGNSPFRGKEKEVEFQKPQKILVLFNLWRNNLNEIYLSSGIKFSSSLKQDQWQTQPYEMIISDYKIGNSSFGY